jgi:hypothetical protein
MFAICSSAFEQFARIAAGIFIAFSEPLHVLSAFHCTRHSGLALQIGLPDMTPTTTSIRTVLASDGREMGRSFVAGGIYMLFMLAIAGTSIWLAGRLYRNTLPQLIQTVLPSKFPRYVAGDLDRAERWNPANWTFDAKEDAASAIGRLRSTNSPWTADVVPEIKSRIASAR